MKKTRKLDLDKPRLHVLTTNDLREVVGGTETHVMNNPLYESATVATNPLYEGTTTSGTNPLYQV